ncbi:MAG: BamA/TamA family outer membrane protein [Flavobacteriales bacterium]|nr:BamA/TamA family outer membrane protein [Flavobacteriales bacterium]
MRINLSTNILLILILLTATSSCISTKRVEEGDYLLESNTIHVNNKRTFNSDDKRYIKQHPNQNFFGFYPFYLHMFNLSDINPSIEIDKYKEDNPNTINFMEKAFSQKAVKGLERDYISLQEWLKETGEKPVISKKKKVTSSTEQLIQLYKTKGFFKATGSDSIKYEYKKAKVKYYIATGPAYFIDSIEYEIPSEVLLKLYKKEIDKSFIKKGEQFNQSNFYKEQKRLSTLFKNNGVYNFQNMFIKFEADSNLIGHKVNVKLQISDFPIETKTGVVYAPHKQYTINKINVYTDHYYSNFGDPIIDSIEEDNFYFLSKSKNRFKPRALTDAIYFEPGKLYSNQDRKISSKLLGGLGMFRMTDIKVSIDTTDTNGAGLISNIYLTPLKRNTTKLELEGTNSNTLGLGFAATASFTNRNTFGGAEIFNIALNGMVGNQKDATLNNDALFNAYQYGIVASMQFPRFLLPIESKNLIPKSMRPRTTIRASLNNQLNIGLSKNSSNAAIDYTWNQTNTKEHNFQAYNLQYIKYLNSRDDYFRANPTEADNIKNAENEYLEIHPKLEPLRGEDALYAIMLKDPTFQSNPYYSPFANSVQRYQRLTQDYLISSFSYTYTYNNQRINKDHSFLFFKGKVELAGTLFSLVNAISPLDEITSADGHNSKTIFGLPYAQFVKVDLDFRKYWRLNRTDKIAFRALTGMALPFGNSAAIPFERSYFAGGVSDVRAWRPYELGPGGVQDYPFDYSYDVFKITLGLEYRMQVFGKLHGAVFVDAGNIWGFNNNEEASNFRLDSFYKQFAVGTGFGARYDFNFFVFRFDFGYKTYDPSEDEGKRWVIRQQSLIRPQVNFAVGYPF